MYLGPFGLFQPASQPQSTVVIDTHCIQLSVVIQILYILAIGAVKLSLLFQLLRICSPLSRMRTTMYLIFTLSIALTLANFFVTVFQCVPLSYTWDRVDPLKAASSKGRCLEYATLQYTVSATNILMDVIVWIAPMHLVYMLQLPRAQKWGLVGVFSLGAV